MNCKSLFAVSITFAASVLAQSGSARAQTSFASDSNVSASASQSEASQMVPAQAVLDKGIDARKMQPGEQFRAKLSESVQLKNGMELPRDAVLVGTIATDQMQGGGTSTLALRFTQAQLKSGKVVPIQADIMGVAGSASDSPDPNYPNEALTPWDGKSTQVDETGAISGVELHSSIGSPNSGEFVSKKKDEMKLSAGSQISLAIAAA
ncbi:MAG: hypothetical protein ABSE36_19010 [Terracidiphilus sp.]|jgi:hypothetical protein